MHSLHLRYCTGISPVDSKVSKGSLSSKKQLGRTILHLHIAEEMTLHGCRIDYTLQHGVGKQQQEWSHQGPIWHKQQWWQWTGNNRCAEEIGHPGISLEIDQWHTKTTNLHSLAVMWAMWVSDNFGHLLHSALWTWKLENLECPIWQPRFLWHHYI